MAKKEHSNILKVIPYAHRYSFHLKGEIMPSEYYTDYFVELENASHDDLIDVSISSTGGDLLTAIEFRNILINSPAHVRCTIVGDCMSAATLPFLAADSVEIADNTRFMVHTFSAGYYGNGHELITNAQFMDTWSRELFTDVYKNFLTESEIYSILSGITMYMGAEEVRDRCKKLFTKTEEETNNG